MKRYRLKQWYPRIPVYLEDGYIISFDENKGIAIYEFVNGTLDTFEMSGAELECTQYWELIEEKEPLFIAKDGAVFFDDFYYLVTKPYFVKTKLKAKENVYKGDGFIYFKHESNADEYIWRNKPVFSYEDFIKWANDINASFEELSQLAKERCKE